MRAPSASDRRRFFRVMFCVLTVVLAGTAVRPATAASGYTVSIALSKTTVTAGTRVTISGRVGPAAPGRSVLLQKYTTRWTSVASTKLDGASHYSFRPTAVVGRTSYRVLKPAGSGHAAGASTLVRLVGVKPGYASVSVGWSHACALKYDGSMWCFGSNFDGQLGLGSTQDVRVPQRIGTSTWLTVKTGWLSTCGVRHDRTLWCTGKTEGGGPNPQVAITGPGKDMYHFTRIDNRANWAEVTPGTYGGCGRTTSLLALCWGYGWHGSDGTDTWTPYPVVYPNWLHVSSSPRGGASGCGIRTDEFLWCFPDNTDVDPIPHNVGLASWSSLESGFGQNCGLQIDKTLWCWGDSTYGQSGPGPTSDTPQQVTTGTWKSATAGYAFSCGVRSTGSAWCWGSNEYGKLGSGSYSPMSSRNPVQVGVQSNWVSVDAGTDSACGTRTDGSLWCWGMVTGPGDVVDPDQPAPTHATPVRIG